jgi:hypothetical protein
VLDATGALVGVVGLRDLAEAETRTPAARGASTAPAALRTLQQIAGFDSAYLAPRTQSVREQARMQDIAA